MRLFPRFMRLPFIGGLGLQGFSSLFTAVLGFVFFTWRITPTQLGTRMNSEVLYSFGDQVTEFEMLAFPEPKIIGGNLADENNHRYMVNLVSANANYRFRFCGGVLIKEDVVLTAAHCVGRFIRFPWRLRVQTGRYDISYPTEKGGEEFEATSVHIHPNSRRTGEFDLALVMLKGKSTSPTVKFAGTKLDVGANAQVKALGWGGIDIYGTQAVRLRELDLKTVSLKECREAFKLLLRIKVHDSNICVLPKNGKVHENNVYYGDSGGPIVFKQGNDDVVVGIASRIFPFQVLNGGFPSMFSKVNLADRWIQSTIQRNSGRS